MKLYQAWTMLLALLLLMDHRASRVEAKAPVSEEKKAQRFKCLEVPASSTQGSPSEGRLRCFMTTGDQHFEQIQESEMNAVSTSTTQRKRIHLYGLKVHRETFWVIVLSAANVFLFICLCWYKRTRTQAIELQLDE